MPMNQVSKDQPITKSEFHQRLRQWFQSTDEQIIGSDEVDGRTRWIFIQEGASLFTLHADTSRQAVEWYLSTVTEHGDDLAWEVTQSQRGKMTAVAYGPTALRKTAFYLYVV